jgi:hypothetical protein
VVACAYEKAFFLEINICPKIEKEEKMRYDPTMKVAQDEKYRGATL